MATKNKFYGKDFQKKMDELKGGHKGVELTKGNRLPRGYEIVKGADKNHDYSQGKKKVVGLKKGYRLAHGYVATKGAKNKKYEDGGVFEDEEYADGGRLTTNEDLIKSFLTTKDNKKVGNLLTKYNSETDEVFLINYSTIIAKKKKSQVTISTKKYSVTTTKIQNMIKRMAEQNGLIVKSIEEFANGGMMGEKRVRIIKDYNFDGYFKIVDDSFNGKVLEDNIRGVNNAILIAEDKGYDIVSVDIYENDDDEDDSKYAKGGNFGEENTEMVANQNKAIKHHTEELKKILESGIQAPAWVVAKVGRAANDLSDVTHYLDGEKMANGGMMAKGGKIKKGDIGKSGTQYGYTLKEYEENAEKNGLFVSPKEWWKSIEGKKYTDSLGRTQTIGNYAQDESREMRLYGYHIAIGMDLGSDKIPASARKYVIDNNLTKEEQKYATGGGVKENSLYLELSNIDHTRVIKWMSNQFDSESWGITKSGSGYIIDTIKLSKTEVEDLMYYLKQQNYISKYATGGGVGYEILDDLKYDSYAKGGNMDSDEKMFCDSIKNRFIEKENPTNEELKKAIQENMDSYSDEGKAIAKSVLSKI